MIEDTSKNVTEIFITYVQKDQAKAYYDWLQRLHKLETSFPGFQKFYIQTPKDQEGYIITFLQFDTTEHLENWMNSPQRQKMLEESKDFVKSMVSHRLDSSFEGWFVNNDLTLAPPIWKQTMLVLLVLFPIVMLERFYLYPHLHGNETIKTFISNAISVSLISWPCLPIVIIALHWWLKEKNNIYINLLGIFCVLFLYFLEIVIFMAWMAY